jgi:hypothetical protein
VVSFSGSCLLYLSWFTRAVLLPRFSLASKEYVGELSATIESHLLLISPKCILFFGKGNELERLGTCMSCIVVAQNLGFAKFSGISVADPDSPLVATPSPWSLCYPQLQLVVAPRESQVPD